MKSVKERKEVEVRAGVLEAVSVCRGKHTELQSSSQPAKEMTWKLSQELGNSDRNLEIQSGSHHCSRYITNGTFRIVPVASLSPPQNHLHFAVDFHSELAPDFRQGCSKTTSDLFLVVLHRKERARCVS